MATGPRPLRSHPQVADAGLVNAHDIPYAELPVPVVLGQCVAGFWQRRMRDADPGDRHHVLPDGCLDILCDLSPGRAPRLRVIGAMTRAIEVVAHGPVEVLAVRFRPGAAAAFLGPGIAEWRDQQVDLNEVWSDAEPLAERLSAAASTTERVAILAQRLSAERARHGDIDRGSWAAVRLLEADPTRSIGDLARDLGITRQHLARSFRAQVGLEPKQLQRVLRMRRAVEQLRKGVAPLRVALEVGYFDQSHLNAELKALTGLTPAAYRLAREWCHRDCDHCRPVAR